MIELLPVFNNTFLSGVVDYIHENMGFKQRVRISVYSVGLRNWKLFLIIMGLGKLGTLFKITILGVL